MIAKASCAEARSQLYVALAKTLSPKHSVLSSIILATKGFTVHDVDASPQVVNTINAGKIHIHEPELDALVRSAVQGDCLQASLEPGRESNCENPTRLRLLSKRSSRVLSKVKP